MVTSCSAGAALPRRLCTTSPAKASSFPRSISVSASQRESSTRVVFLHFDDEASAHVVDSADVAAVFHPVARTPVDPVVP